ncbi:MAG: tRNA (adenosine(37)-N6)-threonylcarbamoyltransferase complex ATPase subunit type 1 TsaE [Micavibrio aeruginosavorus]|uniref:tRNA threonylcarbamoyladenosine biosynthesis protein TsaE n=1 Tax=Micavibrio aeruginosavorus TaxID=349221 RepID=A0A2W5N5D6_9BACT|nr:MAG: tRNA (adenosine(37)-N6)-threonylcarbamoyltransferase complex ATPase subunit type 1 TsaE [Micavibrio aeruginosavorus]
MAAYISDSEEKTAKIAAQIAHDAPRGAVFLLEGPLGAGKSVFARAFIRSLCGQDTDVPSPTFTLVQTYDAIDGKLWHLDLYRLEDPDEIFEIGLEEAIGDGATILIEWPQKMGPHIPAHARRITLEPLNETTRKITFDE